AGAVELTRGAMDIPGNVTFDLTGGGFVLAGATLTGAGTLTNSGNANWSTGTITGTGNGLTLAGTLAITGSGAHYLVGTLNNTGTITPSARDGGLSFSDGVLNNLTGAAYDLQTGFMQVNSGSGTFNNSGTLRKSANTDTATVGVPFTNSGGAFDVQAGI